MALLKSCCCWKSVRSGSFASGIYTMMTASTYLEVTTIILLTMTSYSLAKKNPTTSVPPGVWSEWGPWDEQCSVTCGIGVRRRLRTCSYEGPKKARRCKGARGMMKNCDTKITCPVHGGWAPWASWECTVTCGGGEGRQERECTNPVPMFGGKDCEGPKVDEGKCNEQPCPDQVYTLSPATVNALKNSIDKGHYNFEKKEGDTVKIPCRPDVVNSIYKAYPNSALSWIKNGAVLPLDVQRMKMTSSELTITKLKPEDNGVYVCSISYAPEVVKPVTVASVTAISPKPNVVVHAQERLVLVCNGAYLAAIYGNLTQTWFHNNVELKDIGRGSAVELNKFEIKEVATNMTGTWACRVRGADAQASKSWVTNVLLIKVLPPLKLHHKLLSNMNLMLTICIVIFVAVMSTGTYFSLVVNRTREEFKSEFEKWCVVAKQELEKADEVPEWAEDSQVEWYISETNTDSEDEVESYHD